MNNTAAPENLSVTVTDAQPPAPVHRDPTDLLAVIAQAVADPRMDVEKMERLLAMHQQIVDEQKKTLFMAAMGRVTPKIPQINQNGRIEVAGLLRSRYAKLEDIDVAIRPIIAEEGFSLSFDTVSVDGRLRIICKLSHSAGHFETKQIDLPIDKTGSKNEVQAVGSTVSYGRRMLVKMFFNIVERGEDNDANDHETVTDEQAKDIEAAIQEVKMDKGKFLVFMGVGEVKEILKRDLKKAANAIDVKRRGVK